jgi:hypothetical protein
MPAHSSVPNNSVKAANGIDYAYRDQGEGAVPLVLLPKNSEREPLG